MASIIRDASLAPQGRQKIEWARRHMAVLDGIAQDLKRDRPLEGLKVAVSIHLEAKTAYLAQVLHQGGADVFATGSNPLSTQDDVCAALSESGVTVYATHGCTAEEYHDYLCRALSEKPDVLIDDGGDMVHILHEEHPEWAENLRGGCEETTTGVIRLRSRAAAGKLNFPMFSINDADCKHLFDNLSFHIERGEKIAVIGENGIGKSSLLHALRGELKPDKGRIRWGQEVKVSYFDQENRQLHPELTVIEELWSRWPRKNETEIRTMLGRVLLQGEDVYKKVGVLSGGERAKLAFAILMMERGNFLMLDEPTNHLDLRSKEILEDALRDYEGTLLFVSHDRYLLKAVPDRIIEIFDDHVEVFKGNYDYYIEKQQEKAAKAAPPPKAEKAPSEGSVTYHRSKQQKAEEARRRARLRELEKQIEEMEGEIASIEADLQNPDAFAGDYQKMQEACTRLEERKNALSAAMDEWITLGDE